MLKYNILILSFFVFTSYNTAAQDSTVSTSAIKTFEGKVTYIYQIVNPNSMLISDEDFYRDMPNGGKSTAILTIKGNQYKWEYDNRIEIYNPKTQQIAISSKKHEDSTYFAYASVAEEVIEKIEKSTETKRLLDFNLESYIISTKWDKKTFYYSPSALKSSPAYWKNHNRDFLGNFIQKSSCFPLIIRQKSMLGNWEMTATKVESMKIEEKEFELKK